MVQKVLLTLFLQLTVVFSAFAETDITKNSTEVNHQKYLTVKGLELKPGLRMDDALNAFKAKGWVHLNVNDETIRDTKFYVLRGIFYNYVNSEVFIYSTINDRNIVGKLEICFPSMDSFKELKDLYDRLKSALGKKYHMISHTETFHDKNVNNSSQDKYKLKALEQGKAIFNSKFVLNKDSNSSSSGYILLYFKSDKMDFFKSYYVYITYVTPDGIAEQLSAEDDL